MNPEQNSANPAPFRHVAIFGASRGIGRLAVTQALSAGYAVTAVARDGEALRGEHPEIRIVSGDVTQRATVDRALQDTDAVICALGAPARSRSQVRAEGTQAIVAGMKRRGIRRITAVSVLGAAEMRTHLPFLYRYIIFPLYLERAVRDHERQEAILAASGLDWTIVRPPNLTDGPLTRDYASGFEAELGGLSLTISRADVADLLVTALESPDHWGRKIALSYEKRRTPALRDLRQSGVV